MAQDLGLRVVSLVDREHLGVRRHAEDLLEHFVVAVRRHDALEDQLGLA